jgi:hypothetical protein
MTTPEIHFERLRITTEVSRLAAKYVRATTSTDEINRFAGLVNELFNAIAFKPTIPSADLPDSAFAATSEKKE